MENSIPKSNMAEGVYGSSGWLGIAVKKRERRWIPHGTGFEAV
ncbi:hypothetical protein HNR32_002776 [Pectinatus brassicae]|uniref:Uncharacterized protein n=1 Tax=Pectinatus brassicae TaxID=862415 RepID=A0A840UXM1_9FIRM|nr:hypothetical protein [Pectinatus brassicae]MBB5337614.1 hypothetical protein [Pectinatus brassicae]